MTRVDAVVHRWAEADLVRRLCDALDVAANAIDALAAEGFSDSQEPANSLRPEKIIAESGLLVLVASGADRHAAVKQRIGHVIRRLTPHARSDRILLSICTEPALAWDYALAHACLTRLGHPDTRFDSVLNSIARAQARHGRERPPHRVLEQQWVMRALHLTEHRAPRSIRAPGLPTASGSVLCWPMDLLNGSREDIYAFTHALMYVTDFNLWPRRLPRRRTIILAEAEAALARCLDEEDYDLAGEVLLAWPLTGRSWSRTAACAFHVLADVEDRAGFLPSAGTRLEQLETRTGADRRKYLFATAYHTAYVMGVLCAAALRRLPPAELEADHTRPGLGRVLLNKLDVDGRRPHWREAVEPLSENQLDGLASMLVTIGLRRSVVQRDFIRLHDFLELGCGAGLLDSPVGSQAAEMLARVAIASSGTAVPA